MELIEEFEQRQKLGDTQRNLRNGKTTSKFDSVDESEENKDYPSHDSDSESADRETKVKKKKLDKNKNEKTLKSGFDPAPKKQQLRIIAMSETPDHELVYKAMI